MSPAARARADSGGIAADGEREAGEDEAGDGEAGDGEAGNGEADGAEGLTETELDAVPGETVGGPAPPDELCEQALKAATATAISPQRARFIR